MKVILKSIPFDKSSELTAELDKKLRENTYLIKDKLNDFNKDNPNSEKELVNYFLITNNNGFCQTILSSKDLPEWLSTFLLMQFDKVQLRF